MRIEQVIDLLAEKGITIVKKDNIIYHDERVDTNIPLGNYYGIIYEEDKYKYCFVQQERKNIPQISIVKVFNREDEALTFFFLNRLKSYYVNTFVIPSRDYSIENWDINMVLNIMKKNNIPLKYLSYDNIKHDNSIIYYMMNNEWYRGYIGKYGQMVAKNIKGQESKNRFFKLSLNDLYPLYLLDVYEEELLNKGRISHPFSDVDIANFIGYGMQILV